MNIGERAMRARGGEPTDHQDEDAILQTTGREARRGPQGWNAVMPAERSKDLRGTIRRLGPMIGDEVRAFTLAGLLAIVSVTMLVLSPYLLGTATDIIVDGVQHGRLDSDRLHGRLILTAGVHLVGWAAGYAQAYLLTGALQRSMRRLRRDVEAKLHRLPLPYLDGRARGDLLSRVTNDIDNLAQSLQQSTSQILTALLMLVGVSIMMVALSPLLTLVAFVTVPAATCLMRVVAGRARPKFMEQWRSTGDLNALAEEVCTGHAVVTTFGRQRDVRARFDAENERMYESSRAAQFTSSLVQPLTGLIGNLQFVTVAVVGGLRISSGALTVGGMQAMIQYVRQFGQPMQQVASMTATFQSGMASLERVVELLDAQEEGADPEATGDPLPARGRIVFEDVTFSYRDDTPLIRGFDLVAEPGETVAIVGPTGAGKTTLVNLLLRFHELDGGWITLDGRDITSIRRRQLRSRFGLVLQDTWLFGGTIRDNLYYGNPAATYDEFLEAARVAYVDRFVHSLPDGYDTVVEGDGDSLSAGVKQLLTIAQAFLADPPILVLDEATSSVDTRTEVLIQEAMNALRANRTSFVIAHRLSTIRHADVVVVMDGGRIVDKGDHEELLAREGPYASLYAAQFAGQAT